MSVRTFFIADLHLDPEKPDLSQLVLRFLQQIKNNDTLYILGDLFEYWVGDDAGLTLYSDVISALKAVSNMGCQVTVLLGNRDFLLGETFAQAAGVTLVRDDELMITLSGHPVLLMHGDTLCTDDVGYQAFRQQVRDTQWQKTFLAKSIDERIAFATHLREQSRTLSSDKSKKLMDVNSLQVQSRFAARQCHTMIHGHTHRPFVHTDKTRATQRFVVGDWHTDYACCVVHDETGLHLLRFTSLI